MAHIYIFEVRVSYCLLGLRGLQSTRYTRDPRSADASWPSDDEFATVPIGGPCPELEAARMTESGVPPHVEWWSLIAV